MRLTMQPTALPRTASRGFRDRSVLAVLIGFALLLPGAASAAAADGPQRPDAWITVTGTLERIMVEPDESQVAVAPAEDSSHVVSVVEVDGVLYPVPDDVAVDGVTGDEVVVTVAADPSLTVDEALGAVTAPEAGDETRILAVEAAEPTAAGGTDEQVLDVALGTHKLTVLPVYWGTPDVAATTLAALASTTSAYWSAQSGGALAVQTEVRGWAAITDTGSCNTTTLWNAAMAAHGITTATSGTNHIAVYFPRRTDCGGWAGQATVGGGKIWINGSTLPDVLSHELGHNFGLGHAQTLTCPSGGGRLPLTSFGSCVVTHYADYADVMGVGMNMATGNLNTAFADTLGLSQYVDAGAVLGTTVGLAPLASTTQLRALRVPHADGTLFFDYRPAAAPDVRKTAWAGVQVHLRRIENGVPYTYLLDMKAATSTAFAAPSLPLGGAWDVPGTGIRVGVSGLDSTARLTVGPTLVGADPVGAYVSRVYLDLFGRDVDPVGLAGWTQALYSGTPRIEVANAITYSDEYRLGLIAGSYQTYLGRGPDPAGHQSWLGAMRTGVTIQQMEAGFLASDEYYAQAGGTDAGWVSRLYQHVLGRAASAEEVQSWVAGLAGGVSRQTASMGFLISTEHLGEVVNGYYLNLLGRSIDPTGRSQWVSAVQQGTRVEAIIGGIIASDEYYGKG